MLDPGSWTTKNPGSGINIPDPQHQNQFKKISTKDYGTFEIKRYMTDLRELCSCAGQLAIRGSLATAAGSPAVFTGLSLSSGGAP